MQKKTKYKEVKKLPAKAKKISEYAAEVGARNVAYITVKYDRYLAAPDRYAYPGYDLVCWQGSNIVIPAGNE